ncbi:hypothetical protein KBD71_04115 [Candidatus Woesebacteria bacterium]|nr:hypothetical protein [Candidatus Woesebacteria bacterium]
MVYPQIFLESFDVLTLLLATSVFFWLILIVGVVAILVFFIITRGKFLKKKGQKVIAVKKLTKKEKNLILEKQSRKFFVAVGSGLFLSIGIGHFLGWYLQESIIIAILCLGLIYILWMLRSINLPPWMLASPLILAIILAVVITANQGILVYPDRVVYKSVTSDKGFYSREFLATPKMQLIIYCRKNPRMGGYRRVEQPRLCGSYLNSPTISRFGVVGDINIRRIDEINKAIISTFSLVCTGSSYIDDNPFFFEVVCRRSPSVE